jgi:hypothetical protein
MSTLAHRPLTPSTPHLRLLERRPPRCTTAAPKVPTVMERLEAFLARLPEPTRAHRLGSWTAAR